MREHVKHPTAQLRRRWLALTPVRWLLREIPPPRGRFWLGRQVLRAFAKSQQNMEIHFEGGRVVEFGYGEELAKQILQYGEFEKFEGRVLCTMPTSGGVVFDVGANVGLVTTRLALARPDVNVVAVEPMPANLSRLHKNVLGLSNVAVYACALDDQNGQALMSLNGDGALASLHEEGSLLVEVRRLDDIWDELGRPKVPLVKVDVEGHEAGVLRGAAALLTAERPAVLIEAWTDRDIATLDELLLPRGYRRSQPRRFEKYNHLYTPN